MADRDSGRASADAFRVVDDPGQARLLSDPEALRFFEPFLGRERRVAEAARELGVRIDTLLYRVGRFLDAGLLRMVREERRAGRAVRVYRSSADAYFVPFAVTPYVDLKERLQHEMRPLLDRAGERLARLLTRHGTEGRRIYRGRDGQVWRDAASAPGRRPDPDDPDMPPAEWMSGTYRLREEDARDVLRRLRALWRELEERQLPAGEGERFLTMFLLVPDARDEGSG